MGNYVPPHLGLSMLGGYIKKIFSNVHVKIIDCFSLHIGVDEAVELILAEQPDFVGMTVKTFQHNNSWVIAQRIKEKLEIPIVFGGNHITADPEPSLYKGADFCVQGEGEKTLEELVRHLFFHKGKISEIDGLVYLKDGQVVYNEKRQPIQDIDSLGNPDWSLLELDLYSENIHVDRVSPALPVMASRGCPYSCFFCSTYLTWGHKVRYRSVDAVLKEIKHALEEYGIRTFHFYDDNLLLNREWVTEFTDRIKSENLDIQWICLSRPEIILQKQDLLPLIREAGCRGFELGFETGEDNIYTFMNKQIKYQQFIEVYELLKGLKFDMIEFLQMNFYQGETLYTMWKSEQKLKGYDTGSFNFVKSRYQSTPFPGTKFYQNREQSGMMLTENYDYFYAHFMPYVSNTFLDSSTVGFKLDLGRMQYGFLFKWFDYYFIYEDEVMEIVDTGQRELLSYLNSLFATGITVREVAQQLKAHFEDKYSLEVIIELLGRMFILALDIEGLVYEKAAYNSIC